MNTSGKSQWIIKGKLVPVERLNNSVNGNPRWLLMCGNKVFRTKPNSMLAYGVQNYFGRHVTVTLEMYHDKSHLVDIKE